MNLSRLVANQDLFFSPYDAKLPRGYCTSRTELKAPLVMITGYLQEVIPRVRFTRHAREIRGEITLHIDP